MKQIRLLAFLFFWIGVHISSQAQSPSCDDLQVTVSPSNTVLFGTEVTMTASGMFSYQWQPTDLFEDPSQSVQQITATQSYDYIIKGFYQSSSVVTNGNFTSGNSGFTSNYTYHSPSEGGTAVWNESTYSVTTNAHNVHNNFNSYNDHTTGTGNFMVVNGAVSQGSTVWQQSINVQTNTDYVFTTWVLVIGNNGSSTLPLSEYASIDFKVNGVQLGNWFTPSAVGVWQQFYAVWHSGSETNATITIINRCTAVSGNDFGLDDISFCPMIPCLDTVHIEVLPPMQAFDDEASTCQGGNVELNVIENDEISEGYDITSHLIGNAHHGTATLNNHWLDYSFNPNYVGQDTLYYYLKVGDSDAFNDTASIIITVLAADTTYLTDNVCYGKDYNKNGFQVSGARTKIDTLIICEKTLQNSHGCDSVVYLLLSVIPTDIHILSTPPEEFCNTGFAELTVVSDLPNIIWSTGETTPAITVNSSGIYSVITTDGECTATANTTIPTCLVDIYLPNCFTPSTEDGINDFFSLSESIQSQIDNFEIVIYSRWGEAVFTSVDKGFKWDGKYNGKLQTGETFVYYMRYTNNLGQKCSYKGSVLVL